MTSSASHSQARLRNTRYWYYHGPWFHTALSLRGLKITSGKAGGGWQDVAWAFLALTWLETKLTSSGKCLGYFSTTYLALRSIHHTDIESDTAKTLTAFLRPEP